jgi:TolA-binding protein
MYTFLYNLFFQKRQLRNKLEKLETENLQLQEKIIQKQEHINETNRYWKSKMYAKHNKKAIAI